MYSKYVFVSHYSSFVRRILQHIIEFSFLYSLDLFTIAMNHLSKDVKRRYEISLTDLELMTWLLLGRYVRLDKQPVIYNGV